MRKFKKSLILLITAIIFLAGCSSNNVSNEAPDKSPVSNEGTKNEQGNKEEQVEITFTNWLSTEDATKEIYNVLITKFEQEYPNIKVKSVGIPFNQFKDQVLVMSVGGNPPDVTQANQNFSSAFVGADIAEPLDQLLGAEITGDIVEGSKKGVTYDGKIMAMPWAPHPNALFWNKTLFTKAGLDPEKPPTTNAELLEMAKKIAALGKDDTGKPIYGMGVPSSSVSNSGNFFLGAVLGFGGSFVDASGNVVYDQGTALKEGLEQYKMLITNKIAPQGADVKDLRSIFGNGTLGLTIDGDFGRNTFRTTSGKGAEFDKEWGVTTIPVNKTGKSETIFTEHQLLISKSSKQKEASATFVKWLVSKDAMIEYHKSNGILSSRKSIASLPEMNEDDYSKVFNEQMKTASALPTANPKFDNAMQEATSMIQLVGEGGDTDKAIQTIMPKIKELYKQ